MSPLEIPEFVEAVLRERLVREAAFLALPETVAGIELRQMTLRDYVLLRMQASPLLSGGTPTGEQLATFLWYLSTSYSLDPRARRRFMRRCRYFQPAVLPWLHTRRAMARYERRRSAALEARGRVLAQVRIYVAETLQDRPAAVGRGGFSPSYYSDAAFWLGLLGRHHHQRFEDTLRLPLKQLFQFIKEIKEQTTKTTAALSNPSDAISAAWCASQRS